MSFLGCSRCSQLKNDSQFLLDTFALETSIFSSDIQSDSFHINTLFVVQSFDPNWYHNTLVTFPFQEKPVTAITEFINSNQPVSFPPMLSCQEELISMNTLYPGLLGTCFMFFFGILACIIVACPHISHGGSCPPISIFI